MYKKIYGSGCPTATLQSCPGCPCAGFIFPVKEVAVFAGVLIAVFCNAGTIEVFCVGGAAGVIVVEPFDAAGFEVFVGAEFNGAPTEISHLCPGSPCAGFMPFAVTVLGVDVAG